MKNKPFYLKVFPFLAMLIAASFPFQIHFLYKIPLSDTNKIFSMLTPLNITSMIILVVAASLTLTLNRWIYKVVPVLLLVLFANNAIVGLYGSDYTLAQVALSLILFGFSLKPFYSTEIQAVILNPRLRWWSTPKRYNIEKEIKLDYDFGQQASEKQYARSTNLSMSGLFMKINDKEVMNQFSINDIIDISIDSNNPIKLKAKIIRIQNSEKDQNYGLGLELIKNENHKNLYKPWLEQHISEVLLP